MRSEVIACAGERRLHAGSVTVETAGVDFQREGHFPRVQRFWVHIPYSLFAIPVDRALKPKPTFLKQVGAASLAGADEVGELLFSFEGSFRRRTGPVVAQPRTAISQE